MPDRAILVGKKHEAKTMRTAIILAQAGFISMMAVIGAYGDSDRDKACPLPEAGAHHCAAPVTR
jgi:hypothetical protein